MSKPANDPAPSGKRGFRWDNLFRSSPDPIFFLNNQRRIRYVNPAWQQLTGLSEEDSIGLSCRPNSKAGADLLERVGVALAPPRELFETQSRRIRRANPLGERPGQPRWWDVVFMAVRLDEERSGILGTIHVIQDDRTFTREPLPENLVAIRQRFAERFRRSRPQTDESTQCRIDEQIRLATRTDVPVTLVGQQGTGKSYVARVIHCESDRRDEAFASLDCTRLPPPFVEQLLFNDRCRAHLGLGTLFLQEPAALAREQQLRLADLMSSTSPLPRVVSSMTVSPKEDGRLLPELYAIVAPLTIELPALHERRTDFEQISNQLLQRAAEAAAKADVGSVSAEALDLLQRYGWPGNLRELNAVLVAACRRAQGNRIEPDDLPFFLRSDPLPESNALPLDAVLEKVERRLIALALQLAKNNKTRAAEILSIWRPRLLRRMEALGIAEKDKEAAE